MSFDFLFCICVSKPKPEVLKNFNPILMITKCLFRIHSIGLVKLERLSLYYNNLQSLDSYIFYGLTKLKYLDLERNNLTNLAWNLFKGLSNLWYLDLDNNRIQNLDAQHLKDLQQLRYFFAKNNNISSIENGFLADFNSICVQFLYFENNRCGIESFFDSKGCKRINSTTCDVYETERMSVKYKRQIAEAEKELQVLRYCNVERKHSL